MYDQFGFNGPQGFNGGQGGYYSYGSGFDGFGGFSDFGDFGDLGDIFSSFFGGGATSSRTRNPNGPRKGADLKLSMDITFEEAYLGIYGYDKEVIPYLDSSIDFNSGIYVAQISKDGPSYNSGLRTGDIITKIDETPINKMSELQISISYN